MRERAAVARRRRPPLSAAASDHARSECPSVRRRCREKAPPTIRSYAREATAVLRQRRSSRRSSASTKSLFMQ